VAWLARHAERSAGFLDQWWDHPSYSWAYVWFFVLITVNAWGWILAALNLGLRGRAFRRPLPQPVATAAMPFFLVHQPVILAVAFVVVQWDAGTDAKLAAVFATSLVSATRFGDLRLCAVSRSGSMVIG
jgi:glucan biosynthesis protein C